ncbi:hypothetical protein [Pseudochelatococcus sp. B33]
MITLWACFMNAAWYGAAVVRGAMIILAKWCGREHQPTDKDVWHAVELYRQFYGDAAHRIIGDHMLAASFAPDGRHRRFLKRVSAELLQDQRRPVPPSES